MENLPEDFTGRGQHGLGVADLFRLSLRVFRTKPLRTFLTILGMSVGIGTVLFLISFGYGLQYILIGKLVATEDSLITMEAYFPNETQISITNKNLDEMAAIPETGELSPVSEATAEATYGSSTGLAVVRIVKPNYFRLSGLTPDLGKAFTENQPAAVASSQAVRLLERPVNEGTLGDRLTLNVNYQNGATVVVEQTKAKTPLVLTGIISDDLQPPFIIVPSDYLEKAPDAFKSVLIKARDIDSVEKLRDKLIAKGYLISARIDLVNQAKKVLNIVTITLGVFGVAALIVSAIGMFNTMVVGFLERIYEVGILKSVGASDRDVRNLFLMESVIMGLCGGLGGILFGVSLGQIVNFGLNVLARHLGGKPFTLFITPLWFIFLIIGLSGFIGLFAGLWPAERASRLSPKEAFVRK